MSNDTGKINMDCPNTSNGHRSPHSYGVRSATPPSTRVQAILDEAGSNDDQRMETPPIFTEMETLSQLDNGELEWKQTARWVKFQELVEEGGERWSKPHVSSLSLHSLIELRSSLLNGVIALDIEATNLDQIARIISEKMVTQNLISSYNKEKFVTVMKSKHRHLYERQKLEKNSKLAHKQPGKNSYDMKDSGSPFNGKAGAYSSQETKYYKQSYTDTPVKGNKKFLRKIPPGSEASNILTGEVDFLEAPVTAFVRLANSVNLGNLTEVPIKTRFIFIVLGPQGALSRYHEIGRSIATLFSDEVFKEVSFRAKNRADLLAGFDEFLDSVTALPPGAWNPAIRIEPPADIPSQEARKKIIAEEEVDEEEEERKHLVAAGLVRTGRLFGGFINDIKRKIPFYISDFKDAFATQSIATVFFLYFACLTPIITFGGMLGDATGNTMAAMECLVGGLLCGVGFGIFGGQPLIILGTTGPVLVFDTILYNFCIASGWDYLSFRLWVGIWAAAILVILVAIDASTLVCYITRFTEENFATLIAVIFIAKAVEKVIKIGTKYPMETNVDDPKPCDCFIYPDNDSYVGTTMASPSDGYGDMTTATSYDNYGHTETLMNITVEECKQLNGTSIGSGCIEYCPDIFLFSLLLFFGTFFISMWLKGFKTARFFPTWVRTAISDFAVAIAILSMSALDVLIGIHTPKLNVPSSFAPTLSTRGWLIPFFGPNPWWTCLVALVPALLACILFFMDQQITAVIVNRKEYKLKKGGGYHLDLFVLAVLIAICSLMGIPWFIAATVRSINHCNSLRVESESSAPGEKPQFLGVRENRLTNIIISLMIGVSVMMTPILKCIPMPVLFGVFLYMGFAALPGLQFLERILIMFMPVKYQPDHAYLQKVPLAKVHLFTFVQICCFAALWVIKSFETTSILFPLMLVVMVGIRKMLDYCFTQEELKILDDAFPDFAKKEKQSAEEEKEKEQEMMSIKQKVMTIPLTDGNVMKIPINKVNISEEVLKSGIWKDVNNEPECMEAYNNKTCPHEDCNLCHGQVKCRKKDYERVSTNDPDKKNWQKSDVKCSDEAIRLSHEV